MHGFVDLRHGPADVCLREIRGRATTAATRCRISPANGMLTLRVQAIDPKMLDLIASVPGDHPDPWLYEEDALQIALAIKGQASVDGFLIVNPHLSRKTAGSAGSWLTTVERHATGWCLTVGIPLPETVTTCGISLHRFFRGIRHEVQGLTDALPHPLQPAVFTVLALNGTDPADPLDADFRRAAAEAESSREQRRLDAARERLTAAAPHGDTLLDPRRTMALARDRDQQAVQPGESFLCWNESHFQHALLNLWELTGEAEWLDRLTRRIESVWDCRSCVRSLQDGMWHRLLPTWINDTEGDHTACTLVSGVILGPITRFMRLIRDRAELADRHDAIDRWLPACREILDYHDFEWVDFPDGSGMHLEPYAKGPRRVYPRGGSRINPLNREFFFSLAMLHVARLTGDAAYEHKVTANARFFLNHCDLEDFCLLWEYEHLGLPATGEDLSHAAAQIAFAEACQTEGIVFSERDLRRMAHTLEQRVFRHGDVPCEDLRGFYPGLNAAVGVWSPLCRHAPHLLPIIRNVVAAGVQARERIYTAEQGWGLRILTTLDMAGRALAAEKNGV